MMPFRLHLPCCRGRCRGRPARAPEAVSVAAAQDRSSTSGSFRRPPPICGCPMRRSCKRVAPAVVNVYAAKAVQNRNPLFDDPLFRRFFGAARHAARAGAALARLRRDRRRRRARRHQQPRHRGRRRDQGLARRQARIRGRDRAQGCAHRPRGAADQGSRASGSRRSSSAIPTTLQVGDLVLAIGNPFGVGQTVTHGIVSALARTQVGITDYQFFIQTDAAINPGNSGGALVDLHGQPRRHQHRDLLALRRLAGHRLRHSRQHGAGRRRLGARAAASAVKRPWLGAKLQAVTPEIAESLGLKRPAGALVASVSRRAARRRAAGLKTGDLIVAVDGQAVDDPNAFDYRFAHQAARRHRAARRPARRQGASAAIVALQTAPDAAARRDS